MRIFAILALTGLAACAAHDPPVPELAERLAVEPAAPPADCETRVGRLLEQGGDPREHRVEVVEGGSPGLVPVTFAGAVPRPSADADCVVLVDGHATGEVQRALGRPETVRSGYVAGVSRDPNPAYAAAKLRAEHAERRARQRASSGIIATGNPEVDLFGTLLDALFGGAADRRQHRELDDALEALAETPSHIEHETRAAYTFTRTPVTLARRAHVRLVLLDGGQPRISEAPVTVRRTFYLYDGLDPRDVDHAEHIARRADPERLLAFERGSLELPPETLLAALHGTTPDTWPADRPEQLYAFAAIEPAAPAPAPAPAPTPAPEGLVLVEGAGGIAAGFHVAADRIATTSAALGSSSVADVRTADGTRVVALEIAREDGVALLQMPRRGPPLALADGPAPPSAELWSFDAALAPSRATVALGDDLADRALPGSPLVTPGGVVGMLVEAGGETRIVPASRLAALTEGG